MEVATPTPTPTPPWAVARVRERTEEARVEALLIALS